MGGREMGLSLLRAQGKKVEGGSSGLRFFSSAPLPGGAGGGFLLL